MTPEVIKWLFFKTKPLVWASLWTICKLASYLARNIQLCLQGSTASEASSSRTPLKSNLSQRHRFISSNTTRCQLLLNCTPCNGSLYDVASESFLLWSSWFLSSLEEAKPNRLMHVLSPLAPRCCEAVSLPVSLDHSTEVFWILLVDWTNKSLLNMAPLRKLLLTPCLKHVPLQDSENLN